MWKSRIDGCVVNSSEAAEPQSMESQSRLPYRSADFYEIFFVSMKSNVYFTPQILVKIGQTILEL